MKNFRQNFKILLVKNTLRHSLSSSLIFTKVFPHFRFGISVYKRKGRIFSLSRSLRANPGRRFSRRFQFREQPSEPREGFPVGEIFFSSSRPPPSLRFVLLFVTGLVFIRTP